MTAPAVTGPADIRNARRLAELEVVIDGGLTSFVAVGEALLEVRDSKLYRVGYESFEAYCKGRWGFTSRRANQLMDVAEIGTMVPISNERQARELTPVLRALGPAAVRETWAEAVEQTDGHVTSAAIRAIVEPVPDGWAALDSVVKSLRAFSEASPAEIAHAVPERRRAGTARTLRQLGTFLGAIALELEAVSE